MADIVDKKTRSRMMSGIRGKNTRLELSIRKGLHALGFRYRLHDKRFPGTPDIFLPKYDAAIFVHGCFWHGHNCHLFRLPSSNREFWKEKIERNIQRDSKQKEMLRAAGIRFLIVWECSFKGKQRIGFEELVQEITGWIKSQSKEGEIKGYEPSEIEGNIKR